MAGILLFGLIARKSSFICSPLVMFTGITLYGSPISSSATLILRPFGVFQVCSSIMFCHAPRKRGIQYPERCGVTTASRHVVPANAGTHYHRVQCDGGCFNIS